MKNKKEKYPAGFSDPDCFIEFFSVPMRAQKRKRKKPNIVNPTTTRKKFLEHLDKLGMTLEEHVNEEKVDDCYLIEMDAPSGYIFGGSGTSYIECWENTAWEAYYDAINYSGDSLEEMSEEERKWAGLSEEESVEPEA